MAVVHTQLDIQEKGVSREGQPQSCDRRLFMQLLAFTGCARPEKLTPLLEECGLQAVLYADVNDPRGVGLLMMDEDPAAFTGKFRELLVKEPFLTLQPKQEMTMFGRTYSTGRETDLEDWLLHKPRRNSLNPEWSWAIWYPLRRRPEFAILSPEEQGKILAEHAAIGRAYGSSDLAHDVRLACHGLDKNDNEFVIGLLGSELYPLSRIVQDMRKTQQTAKYIRSLGPFFVGRVIWRSIFR